MTKIYVLDEDGVFLEEMDVDPMLPLPRCTLTPPPPVSGAEVARWNVSSWEVLPQRPTAPAPSQFEIDQTRYSKRAAVMDELMAYMAADNMGRVRSGQWTVAELTGLMSDPDVSAATAYMGTLSYELAAQAIAQATTPLLTPEIKAAWVAKLQEHFYLTP